MPRGMRMNGTVNGWTKADVARLRDVMVAQGRDIDEIADEVRSICHVTRLASYRLAHGLSQPQAVARCRVYAQAGVAFDQPTLSRLEQFPARGSRTPMAVHLLALAGAYGTHPVRLLTPAAFERLDPREREVILRLAPSGGTGRQPSDADQALQPAGVPFTQPMPTQPMPTLSAAARQAFSFAAAAEGSNVGPETLAEIESEVHRLARRYLQHPVADIVGELTQIQEVGFRLLEGRQRPPQAKTLFELMTLASGLLAHASHDLGDVESAMTQARAAFVCADNAGHQGLRSWVRGLQSLICYWAEWPREALKYAQLGVEAAVDGRGSAAVWVASHEARAWGMVGNQNATLAALERADRVRERVVGSQLDDDLDGIGGILAFPAARQLYYAAESLTRMPEQAALAEEMAEKAMSAFEQGPPDVRGSSDQAGVQCVLAACRLLAGDVEAAQTALQPVLNLPVPLRVTGVVAATHRVKLAADALTGCPRARRLGEEIDRFCLSPAREQLV
jgi:transcriptional regulator with XRE-family HTH domain